VDANPFYHLIEIFRGPLMSEPVSLTSWSVSLMILAAAALTAVVSLSFTRRQVYLWL
jgi:ABC-type polysaccharide/polyol phosphate export permease